MEDVLLFLLLVIFFFIGLFLMKRFDHQVEDLQNHSPSILIVSNQEIDYDSRYAYLTSTLIENFTAFKTIILDNESDFENLCMNEKISNYSKKIKVYAKVNQVEYLNLYHKSNIKTYQNKEELKNILGHLYDQ